MINQGQVQRFDVEIYKNDTKIYSKYELVKLWDIAKMKAWWTPKRWNDDFWNNWTINWLKSWELKDSINIIEIWEKITEKWLSKSSATLFNKWTLLIAMYWATAWDVWILWIDSSTNQAVCSIIPKIEVNKNYLFWVLLLLRKKIKSETFGWAQPNISKDYLDNLEIPLPPLKIQNKIVEIMESALKIKKQKEEESKELFDSINNFVLWELWIEYEEINDDMISYTHTKKLNEFNRFDPYYFQDKFNTYEWLIEKTNAVELSECTDFLNTWNTPAKSMYTEEKEEDGINIIKSWSNNWNNLINLNKVDFIKWWYNWTYAKQNDIYILASAHQAEYVWKKIYLLSDELKEDTFFVGELLCIRANTEVCNPYYLFSLLDTDLFKLLINRQKRGQTSHIYAKDIKKIKIPLPSLEIQEKIAIEVKVRIEKANILKVEAKEVYESAKKKVEEMILRDI